MNNEQDFKGKWYTIKEDIQARWDVSEGEILQSDGIYELAGVISGKTGEVRPNVQHELIQVFLSHDESHPQLKKYFSETSAARHESIGPEDDGGREIGPNQL